MTDFKLPDLMTRILDTRDVSPDLGAMLAQPKRALGVAVPLSDRFTLSGATSYEDRENSYRRLSGTLALSYRFGTP